MATGGFSYGAMWPASGITSSRAPGIASASDLGLRRRRDHVVLADQDERRNRDLGEVAAPVGPARHAAQGPGDSSRRGLLHHVLQRLDPLRPFLQRKPG